MKFIPIKKLPEASKGEFLFKRTLVRDQYCVYVTGHRNTKIDFWEIDGYLVKYSQLANEGYTHFVKIEEE